MRITPMELAALSAGEVVEEQLPGAWSASVQAADPTGLTLGAGRACVSLSAKEMEKLLGDETEGVYLEAEGDPAVRYSIEKDFPCAHPRAAEAREPSTETFEPPPGFMERKRGARMSREGL
jgi:hypothetical protein